MNNTQHNPILAAIIQTAEAIEFCWHWFVKKIVALSWPRLFAVILLVWILSGLLVLIPLANVFVFLALLVKCFVNPAQTDTTNKTSASLAAPDTLVKDKEEHE